MAKTKSYTFTTNEARVLQILREHYAKTEDVEPQNISIEALIENEVLPAGKQQTVFNGIKVTVKFSGIEVTVKNQ